MEPVRGGFRNHETERLAFPGRHEKSIVLRKPPAHLFLRDADADRANRWLVAPLDGTYFALHAPDGALVLEPAPIPARASARVTLMQRSGPDGGEPSWIALTGSPDVRLNGRPLRAGIGRDPGSVVVPALGNQELISLDHVDQPVLRIDPT